MAKRELIPAKQEKARERLKNFRAELSDFQETFQRLKGSHEENVKSLFSLYPPPMETTIQAVILARLSRRPYFLTGSADIAFVFTSNKLYTLTIITNSIHAALTTSQPPKTHIATLNRNLPSHFPLIHLFTLHLQTTLMPPTISHSVPRPKNILERPTLFANNPSWHKRMPNWMSIWSEDEPCWEIWASKERCSKGRKSGFMEWLIH